MEKSVDSIRSSALRVARLGVIAAALSANGGAWAQLVVGMTSGFTGAVAVGVKENADGAKLVIDQVNATGGVNGQRIELVTMDDKFDPKLAAENARALITEKGAIALFLNRGTPHTEAIKPLLTTYKVPLVAPSTGAMVLHKPVDPWIFNVRATYQREVERVVAHLATIGIARIALVHVDDSFGADCAEGARKGFEKAKLKPLFVEKFDRAKPVLEPIAARVAKDDAQAVLAFGAAASVAELTKHIRAQRSYAQIVTVSNNASGGFIKLMGEHARGTIVTQVFPSERALAIPMVKEAQTLATAKGIKELSPAMLEGFAGAKVLVEGLRRAGPKPTRESLQKALNAFRGVDIGGLEVSYSERNHTGLDFADLSIIDLNGRFQR
jgi:ABC-type branched-subunit amino acid transport system substrate-binding protein